MDNQDILKKIIQACVEREGDYDLAKQLKFAERSGISQSAINAVLKGQRNLSAGMKDKLIANLGIDYSWFNNPEEPVRFTDEITEEETDALGLTDKEKKTILALFARLPAEKRKTALDMVRFLVEEQKKR